MKTIEELKNTVIQGDCLEVMKTLPENSVDSIVTDPPYELGFMGKSWDNTGIANNKDMWAECLRVLKPGGHLLAFSGTRTYHRMASAIEDAGFEVRDMVNWIYSTGFPKSHNVWKQLKKNCTCGIMDEYERTQKIPESLVRYMSETDVSQTITNTKTEGEVLQSGLSEQSISVKGGLSESLPLSKWGEKSSLEGGSVTETNSRKLSGNDLCEMPKGISTNGEERRIHNATQASDGSTPEQTTDENGSGASHRPQSEKQQDREPCAFCKQSGTQALRTFGVGSALKPAHEPICFARKPLEKGLTIAENVLKYGTGGINIDESRVDYNGEIPNIGGRANHTRGDGYGFKELGENIEANTQGRFPANLIHDNSEEVRECFPETNASKSANRGLQHSGRHGGLADIGGNIKYGTDTVRGHNDNGGNASRFFKSIIYQAKASKSERNKGLDSIVLVDILRVWNENNTTKEEKLIRLMVTGISPQKVIAESGVQLKNANEWNTCLFGKHLMEKYQEDIKSITKTETNSITTSQTLNWLTHLLTNEYTVGANLEMENGGNLVENVKNSNSLIITINEAMALALGVKDVVSGTQLKISVKEGSNIHSTVKPIALMEYLIKMVTPKGGIVLDPFVGSGTTGVACKNLNRNYILIEKEPEYIEIINKRLNAS